MKYGDTNQTRDIKKMLNDDVLGEILVHAGPAVALLEHVPDVLRNVAVRRIQRRWRSVCLIPGRSVLWRFEHERRWKCGTVMLLNDSLCIARDRPKLSYVFLPHPGIVWRVD